MAHRHHKPDGTFSQLVSGPAVPLVSLDEAKASDCCNVQHDDDDAAIQRLVASATELVDAEWGELGRALITQLWKLTMPAFPGGGRIVLPISPAQQVVRFQYYDTDNVQRELNVGAYRLTVVREEAYVDLVDGYSWPSVYDRGDAVQIEYAAGFGDEPGDVPGGIRRAVMAIVAYWYEHPSAVTEKSMSEVPLGVRTLLHKYRVARGFI